MSIVSYKLKRLATTLPVAAAIGAGAPSIASADSIQPATTDCVIQGNGTPCVMDQTSSGASSSTTAAGQSAVSSAQAQEGSTQWDG